MDINTKSTRAWSIMGMGPSIWGVAFDEILRNKQDGEEIKILTADLARYSGLQRLENTYEEVVYNIGIAEQNMVGIAAGFALEGISAYMTTYAPFMTYRCADQIRHFMGDMQLPMKAIGSAAGFSAGFSGNALLALSDIAFMRSIPNMTVLSPADCTEAVKLMYEMHKLDGPVYMRYCGTTGLPVVYHDDYILEIGKPVHLLKGKKIAILATGTNLVSEAVLAAKLLEKETGILPNVYDVHTLKPLNDQIFAKMFDENEAIFTVEEHSIIGGLGSAVVEKMVELGNLKKVIMLGAQDRFYKLGNRSYMIEQAGLSAQGIANRILEEV